MHLPSQCTFVASLKVCAKVKDLILGRKLHADIVKQALEEDMYISNTLIDLYSKCGLVSKAEEIFDELWAPDVVSWTTLILGYALHGHGQKALYHFKQMELEGISPNAVTLMCCLKACGTVEAAEQGQELHAEILRKGFLENSLALGNTLVDMYAKCGLVPKAQEVFKALSGRNIVSWNVIMMGHVKHGFHKDALDCFAQLQHEGMSPNALTFTCGLKACGSLGAKTKGKEMHVETLMLGFLQSDLIVSNALVDMYVCCGLLAEAQGVFDKLPRRDVIAWTTLMAGYVKKGHGKKALACFDRMQQDGIRPNSVTFMCSLNACGSVGAADKGEEIHHQVSSEGLLETDIDVGSAVVDMYAKCGLLAKAQGVFDMLPMRNVVTWNSLLTGYMNHGSSEEAICCFHWMQHEGFSPDGVSFVCVLKACSSDGDTDQFGIIHSEISRRGLLKRDVVVGNALVDMYAKCGLLSRARDVLDKFAIQNAVSWNSLITGFITRDHCQEAMLCFEEMQSKGVSPDCVTFACLLKACGSMGMIDKGHEVKLQAERQGLLGNNTTITVALVNMYASFGLLEQAQKAFDGLLVRDVISWTAIISAYASHGHSEEAMQCFKQMQIDGVSPDAITFSCILKACGSLGLSDKGQEIHAEIEKQKLMDGDAIIGNAVVDMYVNCGFITQARGVFDSLSVHDCISWNALLAGYAQLGDGKLFFSTLSKMRGEEVVPDLVTFVSILMACSHGGLVDNGLAFFLAMESEFGLTPTIKHCICMIDLTCRAGQLDNASVLIKKMPFHPNLVTWITVMGACTRWGEIERGREAFKHVLHLDEDDVATYVCMGNICAGAGMWSSE